MSPPRLRKTVMGTMLHPGEDILDRLIFYLLADSVPALLFVR
jgi:hypothetical protein